MLHLILLGLLAILGWAVFVCISPYRTCRWCRPGGLLGGSLAARVAGHHPKPRRRGRRCWRCKGTCDVRRLGAGLVAKIRLAVARAWTEREFWR